MDDLLMDANLFSKQGFFSRIEGGDGRRRFPTRGINGCGVCDVRFQGLILEHRPKSANRKSEVLYWYPAG